MKNLLIIYNIIFLLVGNVIFSNIHYFHNHNHDHSHDHHYHQEDTVADNECLECDVFEVNSGFVFNSEKINFSNNN